MIFIDASAGIDALLVIGLEGERLSLFEGGASGKVIFKIMLEYGVRRVKGALNPLVIGPLCVVAAETESEPPEIMVVLLASITDEWSIY